MKKQLQHYICIIFIIMPFICFSQLTKQWEIYLPSNYSTQPSFNVNSSNHLKTIKLSDGSYVTLASKQRQSLTFGRLIYLYKFSSAGELLWEYTYQNDAGIDEYPSDITVDLDDNIIVAGRVVTFYEQDYDLQTLYSNYLLFKLSPQGEFIWEKELNGIDNTINHCSSVTVDAMGNIYTVGQLTQSNNYNVVLHKYDSQGNEIWSKKPSSYNPQKIQIVGEEIFAITKQSQAPSPIYKYDLSGELLDSFLIDQLTFVNPKIDHQGNVYIFSFNGQYKIEKYNSIGDLLWTYHKETNLPSNVLGDELQDFELDEMGNVYATGRYYGEHYGNDDLYTNGDILTVKLDSEGEVIWENIYNFDGTRSGQNGAKVQIDELGRTYVLGHQSVEVDGDIFASKDLVLLIYNTEGEIVKRTYHNGIANRKDSGINFFLEEDGIYVLGYSQNDEGQRDYNIIKYSHLTSNKNLEENYGIVTYPNPSHGKLNIDCDSELTNLKVIDKLGRIVYQSDFMDCDTSLDLSNNPSGIYYLYYEVNNKRRQGSIAISK